MGISNISKVTSSSASIDIKLDPKTKKDINDLARSFSEIKDEKKMGILQLKLHALASKGPNELKEVIDALGWWLRKYKVPDKFSANERDILENRILSAMNSLKDIYENIDLFIKDNKNKFKGSDDNILAMKLQLKGGIIEVFKIMENSSPLINVNLHAHTLLGQWHVQGYEQIVD